MNHKELKRYITITKKQIIADIMDKVKPFMWESGFVHHPKNLFDGLGKPLILYVFESRTTIDKHGNKDVECAYKIINELYVEGFTEHGAIITDAYGGGLATQDMKTMFIEELIALHSWVMNKYDFKNNKKIK